MKTFIAEESTMIKNERKTTKTGNVLMSNSREMAKEMKVNSMTNVEIEMWERQVLDRWDVRCLK